MSSGTFSNFLLSTVSPASFSLTNAGQWISYQMNLNVDFITGNDGEGWTFRLWNADFSQLDVGVPRILREGAVWRILTQFGGLQGPNFNFDTWYNLRIKVVPTGFDPAGNGGNGNGWGNAFWYADNVLFYTEPYTNRALVQLKLIDTVDIRTDIRTPAGTRMYMDDLGVEALPEPTALTLLGATGGLLVWAGHRRARRK